MADHRPLFLFVSANGCGHCEEFKEEHWNNLKNRLNNAGSVRVEERELASLNSPVDVRYSSMIRGFPAFLLLNGNQWNLGVASGVPYNHKLEGKATANSVEKWVLANLSKVR